MPTSDTQQIVRQILAKRGLSADAEIEAFLHPNYEKDLHDPFLLLDMEPAVTRILEAVKKQETVVIYGDYDIDGITASAVMIETLDLLGLTATSYIPDRFEEGYGINQEALQKLKADGVDLVITVDCGITSAKEIEWAIQNKLDVIVTDHHAVPELIPETIAVINPKRPGDVYPFKDLAGVGVAFKLAQALLQRSGAPTDGREKWLLDLVALGTVCDVVTLVGENRVLAKYGLLVMNKSRRVGIRALASVSGAVMGGITSYHLGFVFGPRMNAAGRLEHAARSLELMMTEDGARADEIARELDTLNRQRQADQARIVEAAATQAEQHSDDPMLVLAGEDWNHGIVGIVASKLVERFRKPTLVMQIMGDITKGSARSLGSFNLVEALRAVSPYFIKFGGHHFAAGYTLHTKDIDALRADLNAYARKQGLTKALETTVGFDLELDDFAAADWDLLEQLEALEPFGNANPKPRFESKQVAVASCSWVGKDKNHLRLTVSDALGNELSGIAFDKLRSHPDIKPGSQLEIVYQLDRNEFNGRSSLQILVQHIIEH